VPHFQIRSGATGAVEGKPHVPYPFWCPWCPNPFRPLGYHYIIRPLTITKTKIFTSAISRVFWCHLQVLVTSSCLASCTTWRSSRRLSSRELPMPSWHPEKASLLPMRAQVYFIEAVKCQHCVFVKCRLPGSIRLLLCPGYFKRTFRTVHFASICLPPNA